jgi:hypothetical protein
LLLTCTIAAYLLNIIGILKYNTSAKELLTQIPVVLLVALIIYAIVAILRLIYYLISKLWTK